MSKGLVIGGVVAVSVIGIAVVSASGYYASQNDLLFFADDDKNIDEVVIVSGEESSVVATKSNNLFSEDEIDIIAAKACDLLSIDDIIKTSLSDTSEDDINYSDFLGCTYYWEVSDIDALEAYNNKVIAESNGNYDYMIANSKPSENSISLFVDDFFYYSTIEAADLPYRSATNNLEEEEKQDAIDVLNEEISNSEELGDYFEEGYVDETVVDSSVEKVFTNDFTPVNDLGTRAAWSETTGELVVQLDNLLFTVTVEAEEGIDAYKTALLIANNVLDRI